MVEFGVVTCTLEPGPQPAAMKSKTTDKTKKCRFFISLPPEIFKYIFWFYSDNADIVPA
jgi:hypothetical protein